MSDPVPAVTEAAATGETAAIFADIRQVLGVDVVNLVWRHLATIDGALPWAWRALRPLYADGSVAGEAAALRSDLVLPSMPAIRPEVYAGLGLRPNDLAAIRDVLAAYDHTNAMAAVALTALRARLDGRAPGNVEASEPMPVAAAPRIWLPKLLDLSGLRPETAALVTTLNGFGTRRPGAVLASMYRHLAHWPPYLSFAWLLLAPPDSDGRLAGAIDAAQRLAASRADRLLVRLAASAALPPPALAARISAAIEPFAGDVIVKMLVICAFLRRVTA
ncbi:MAG TPA: hypothetical protein VHB27_17260 [Rhodopila sp.]|uniref:hypothetical protein n=1 Tax=Rhodopila sp. TaxID=2480087 RepID=UPI002CBA068A|nr:hypothetical protein [Rhodopila sp.]HVY16974.1 hypothetical protein [Rhodopila sp.]